MNTQKWYKLILDGQKGGGKFEVILLLWNTVVDATNIKVITNPLLRISTEIYFEVINPFSSSNEDALIDDRDDSMHCASYKRIQNKFSAFIADFRWSCVYSLYNLLSSEEKH